MTTRKLLLTMTLALLTVTMVSADDAVPTYLTLQGCRDLALQGNKQVRINKENLEAAKDMRKAALAKFFPKFSANGAYIWNQNNLYLMADEATLPFGTMNADGTFTFNQNLIKSYYPQLDAQISDWAAEQYTSLRNETSFDIENMFVGEVGVRQPIFLGGKLVQLYKISKALEEIEGIKSQQTNQELTVQVDEAYWRVISVEQKYKLAKQYCDMLRQMEENVAIAKEEGTATQGDLLKVRVKLNEAEISLTKAEDGLQLSKMALCQLIGLDLNSDLHLEDAGLENVTLVTDSFDMAAVWANRPELQMLEEANKIAKSGVKVAASTLMPNVVAGATYYITNPNLFNGLSNWNTWGGSFAAGVMVNIPIAHADDILTYKAAKHKAKTVELQLAEAREKIELQVNQSQHQLNEANKKLIMANANIANAEENLRLAQAAYDEGMLTATELLGAQTAWLKAYSEKLDAAIDLRMYEVYLKKNKGQM